MNQIPRYTAAGLSDISRRTIKAAVPSIATTDLGALSPEKQAFQQSIEQQVIPDRVRDDMVFSPPHDAIPR